MRLKERTGPMRNAHKGPWPESQARFALIEEKAEPPRVATPEVARPPSLKRLSRGCPRSPGRLKIMYDSNLVL